MVDASDETSARSFLSAAALKLSHLFEIEDEQPSDSEDIEGTGNEVLTNALFYTLFSFVLSYIVFQHVRRITQQIHPLELNFVHNARNYIFRDSNTAGQQLLTHQEGLPPSVESLGESFRAYGMDSQCPICLGEPRLPIRTNCGHLFCANCIIVYWRHGNWMGPVRCPVCRTQVSVMLTCFRVEGTNGLSEEDINARPQLIHDINDYNRRFSGEPRPWLDYLRDLPTLLRHISSEFFTLGSLMYMLRIRIVICFMAAIMYLISPLDLIPEAVFGIIGLLDDVFVVLLLAIYVTMVYRQFLASRWTADD